MNPKNSLCFEPSKASLLEVVILNELLARRRREYVTHVIEGYLYRNFCEEESGPPSFIKIQALARVMEGLLFKSANSIESYADMNTLEMRLKGVASLLLRCKLNQPKINYSVKRRNLLQKQIGEEKFFEIERIVHEINTIRSTSNAWTFVFSGTRKQPDSTTPNAKYLRVIPTQSAASEMMPPALYKLYFDTRLPQAWGCLDAKTCSLESERVTEPRWESLLIDAKEAVASFRMLESEVTSNVPESELSKFGCGSSGCFTRSNFV